MRILGIDPGSRTVGFGCLEQEEQGIRVALHGVIRIGGALSFPEKLQCIHAEVFALIQRFRPVGMAVESVYVAQNARSSLLLGHARGVILLAAAQGRIPVYEYAPREIKQGIVGRGDATKDQVRSMIGRLLGISPAGLSEDEADALAIALFHTYREATTAIRCLGGRV